MARDVPWIGARIRDERARQGITVRGLAAVVGVSASMISQIENGRSRPSVSTLYAITSALGMSVEDLFREPAEAMGATTPTEAAVRSAVEAERADSSGAAGAPPTAVAADDPVGMPVADLPATDRRTGIRGGGEHKLGPLVRPDQRRVLTLDTGVTWELLGDLPGRTLDFLRITYPPGATSASNGGLMRHQGCEYGFVLAGELILTLGFEEIRLRAGDAVSFESSTPHGYRNDGTVPAVGIWFVTEER
jgi:transcriptional regulator with XRE-family HTH domain/quercetin dioxygenase-like cupin family protein